jgi:GNAT superfamily N-acetyltransferase
MDTLDIREEYIGSEVATALIRALDEDLARRYPGSPINGVDVEEFVAAGGYFVVTWLAGQAVGCGAFRPLSRHKVEIKRMFVVPEARGQGIARCILKVLESVARERGFSVSCLETGNHQPEAIGLYRSVGYKEVPPFGPYIGNPVSVCFEKVL